MTRAQPVENIVSELEYSLAKNKAVLAAFPDAKAHYSGYTSKAVNQAYTKFVFEKRYGSLYVLPYCEVEFNYNNQTETIKIYSQPRANRLVYLSWRRAPDGKRVMKFSRMIINFKNNQIKDEILNACRGEILGFIRDNPGNSIDYKHLEPRLKKLMVFI